MRAAAQKRRVYRPGGRRMHLPSTGARPAASRIVAPSRIPQDEAHIPDWPAVESDARWHSSMPRHRSWGGALLSLGLHLGAAAMVFVLMLQFPEGASAPEKGPESVDVEIISADAFDAAFTASGAQPATEIKAKSVEAPVPDIPPPPDIPMPTERDLLPTAEMPALPLPSELMPDPVEMLKREIAQDEPETRLEPRPQPPIQMPEQQVEKPVAKAEAPKKSAPKAQPKPKRDSKRDAARGQGESGKDTDATSSLASSRGAPGRAGTASGNASANPSFRASVMAHLARYKRYPEAARIQRLRGRVMVTFSLDAAGTVTGVSLASSSGHGLLDTEALAMVRRASPFPRIPPEMGQANASFTAPIVYDMN